MPSEVSAISRYTSAWARSSSSQSRSASSSSAMHSSYESSDPTRHQVSVSRARARATPAGSCSTRRRQRAAEASTSPAWSTPAPPPPLASGLHRRTGQPRAPLHGEGTRRRSVVAERRRLLGGLVEQLRGRLVAVDRRVCDVMAALDRIEAHSRQPRVDSSPLIRQRQLERRRCQQRVGERQSFAIELENVRASIADSSSARSTPAASSIPVDGRNAAAATVAVLRAPGSSSRRRSASASGSVGSRPVSPTPPCRMSSSANIGLPPDALRSVFSRGRDNCRPRRSRISTPSSVAESGPTASR